MKQTKSQRKTIIFLSQEMFQEKYKASSNFSLLKLKKEKILKDNNYFDKLPFF